MGANESENIEILLILKQLLIEHVLFSLVNERINIKLNQSEES